MTVAVELRESWSEYAVAEEYGFAIPKLRLDCFCRWDLNGAIISVCIKPRDKRSAAIKQLRAAFDLTDG